jgi:translation initiation factor 2 alpha subunit (eIF-2alpha)
MFKFNSNYRYYRNELPKESDIVIGQVVSRSEDFGYNIRLLEYDGILGFIIMSELSRKTRHRKKNIVSIGDIFPFSVLSVVPSNKLINLSRKFIKKEEIGPHLDEMQYKTFLHKLVIEVFNVYKNTYPEIDVKKDDVLENTLWKIFDDQNGNDGDNENDENYEDNKEKQTYKDVFYEILNNPPKLFHEKGRNYFDKPFIENMVDYMKSRITQDNCIYGLDVSVMILNEEGIYALKEIFDLKENANNHKLRVNFSAIPTYNLTLEGSDVENVRQTLNSFKDIIHDRTTKRKGIYNLRNDTFLIKEPTKTMKFMPKMMLDNYSFIKL